MARKSKPQHFITSNFIKYRPIFKILSLTHAEVHLQLRLVHYLLLYFHPTTKYKLDRLTRCRDMAIKKFSKMAAGSRLEFAPTGSTDIRSADPKTLPQPNAK